MSDRTRVLIVDDEPLAREGLKKLCGRDPGIEVVGECADGRAAARHGRVLFMKAGRRGTFGAHICGRDAG